MRKSYQEMTQGRYAGVHLHFLVGCIIFIRVFHEDQFSEFGRLLSILLCLEVRFLFIMIMIIHYDYDYDYDYYYH